ncbi:hypothetical protein D043_2300B, partial [Vibrio parahaemolyticus EKP-021]
FACLTFNQKS